MISSKARRKVLFFKNDIIRDYNKGIITELQKDERMEVVDFLLSDKCDYTLLGVELEIDKIMAKTFSIE